VLVAVRDAAYGGSRREVRADLARVSELLADAPPKEPG
jgi:hypothetical protein